MKTLMTKAVAALVLTASIGAGTAALTTVDAGAARIQWSAARCGRVAWAVRDSYTMMAYAQTSAEYYDWLQTAQMAESNYAAHC